MFTKKLGSLLNKTIGQQLKNYNNNTKKILLNNKNLFNFCAEQKTVNIIFVNKDKSETPVKAEIGKNILQIAHENEIDLEGACEMSLACSTCHVIFEQDLYDKLEEACEEEEDLLDLAFGLTETSRLGCQVKVDESFEGQKVYLPSATRNFYVDGHKPQPH
ncbi:2Fe-2S ferredoxin-type domain [Pseudocohnilembus persalinus]|uniref:2Fe-2S ferredoxin n=1 Tax=Pseudocohnilembus persalinus TaxID=266149 RepID=A0A0V0R018_PSEPJ|nr:2Fe-2S ferredoxin-type domain [Pseudocohnilembus persalinus]|eukprot:KRX07903.1 2Fe-2S ferredoxin-type domain [Pseudocohnilembus persalinus]